MGRLPSETDHLTTAPSHSPPSRPAGRFALLALLAAMALPAAWLAAPALAQDPPDAARIGTALVPELPAWWSVASVEVRSTVNDGDAVEPRWRQHFLTDAAPREPLYVSSGETAGPFEVLIPTRLPTEMYRLYGTARSRLKLGDWVTEVVLDNTVAGLGQPRSLFDGPVVVAGSGEAERTVARLAIAGELAGTLAESLARTTADVEALRQSAEEAATALDAANRQRLNVLRTEHEEGRAALAAASERERAALEVEHRARLEALQSTLAAMTVEIAAMPVAAETERAGLVARNRERLDALQAKHEEERAALEAAGERARAAAKEDAQARLEALKVQLIEASATAEARTAAFEAERTRLVTEHQDSLAGLRARNEAARAAATATPETLLALSQAQAKAAAEREFVAALQTQMEEGKSVEAAAVEATAADLESRTAWYDTLLKGLGSNVIAERNAALDLALASNDEGLRVMAFVLARVSDDTALMARAFDTALVSDHEDLKAQAFAGAFASSDSNLKRKALDAALASGDREIIADAIEIGLASDHRELRRKAVDTALDPNNEWLATRLTRTSQWAKRVVDFSSQASNTQSAEAALGPPQVEAGHECVRGLPSWYAGGPTQDEGMHYVRMAFTDPVLWPEIVVYETGNHRSSAGFVRKLILWDADGNSTEYPVQDSLRRCPGASTFDLRRHQALVTEVTVVIDTDHVRFRSEGIDAIKLMGTPVE